MLGDMKVLKLMQDFMTERYHMAIVADVQEKVGASLLYIISIHSIFYDKSSFVCYDHVIKLGLDFLDSCFKLFFWTISDLTIWQSPSEQSEEKSDLKEYKKQKIGPVRYLERKLSKAFMSAPPEPEQVYNHK